MRQHGSLPSYDELFGELAFHPGDESRSVYSPAAYLADLLHLLGDGSGAGPAALAGRRPDIQQVPLDGERTYTELPYLDIVNEVLERAVREARPGDDAYQVLRDLRFPFTMPFSLRHERVRRYLHQLGVDPADLYRLFATDADPDIVARECLGLTPVDATLLTTELGDGPELRECYQLAAGESFAVLESVDRFRLATSLSLPEVGELLFQDLCATPAGAGPAERSAASAFFIHQGGAAVTLDDEEQQLRYGAPGPIPVAWFERVNRFVRLARRVALSLTDLDLVLRTCCGNRIDPAALRAVAVVLHLRRTLELPIDVVVSLVAPINTLGFGNERMPRDLFNRVFNVPFAETDAAVIRGSGYDVPGYAGRPELSCNGDILATRNEDYRRRICQALSISAGDLAAIVERYRRTEVAGPFDGEIGLSALSLLHRFGRLATSLGVRIADLFDVLDLLAADPSIRRHPAFPMLIAAPAPADPVDGVLAGDDAVANLWLVQVLVGAVRWMQAAGFTGRELLGVTGGAAGTAAEPPDAEDGLPAVLDRLGAEFGAVELAPELFVSDRFSDRAAQVLHSVLATDTAAVVSDLDDRILRVEPDRAAATAYLAITALPVIVADDFQRLGLDERGTARIFAGLVRAGQLEPNGVLVPDRLPSTPAELVLARDFTPYRERLFALIAELGGGAAGDAEVPAEPVSLFPSDLAVFAELTPDEQAELHENLVFNGHLDAAGLVVRPDFFADPANALAFTVNVDLGEVAPAVLDRLRDRAGRFGRERPTLDPTIFAGLRLTPPQTAALLGSLRFNGHLDPDGGYRDPAALLALDIRDFGLALEFYPHRRRVLAAIQAQLGAARTAALRMTEDDFRDIADAAAAQRVIDRLAETHLVDGRVPAEEWADFADPGNTLDLDGFTASENATIFDRLAEIHAECRPYHLDLAALADLGFDPDRQDQLVAHLVAAGHLTETFTVPPDRLDHFGTVHNALGFELPGLADYRTDIFFLLHTVAVELTAGIDEIVAAVSAGQARQRTVLATVLQDSLGVPAATVEAICAAVTGGPAEAVDLLVVPALAGTQAPDLPLRRAYRRIRGFARLAGRLDLAADEVTLAFRDQHLVEKYPEPLALPAEVDRIDALLESTDGRIYLFRGRDCWTYSASTHTLVEPGPRTLDELSARLAGLARVDAAFVDATGTEWLVGRDDAGAALAFVREPGSTRWAPRQQDWGTVTNNFADPARIDAAFVDDEGRSYLFCGDQYVRYSGTDHARVDDGYPRRIGEWWEHEQHSTALPGPFRQSLDAVFRGRDGRTYLFAGQRFVAVGPGAGAGDQAIGDSWGRVRNNLAEARRVDAGYTAGPAQFLVAGDQVLKYSDSIENPGVRADPGYPRRIAAQIPDLPGEFEGGLAAAFVDPDGVLHLFRDGRTVALGERAERFGPAGTIVATAQRWGVLGPVLPTGTVDAGFVGSDGRTYLFSGDRYLRYSTADYSTVDVGYPRGIAPDWGGLRQVDAAVVLDGATHLFGVAGSLFDLPATHAADLDAGRVPRELRRRLGEHGIPVAEEAAVSGRGPQWRLTAGYGIGLELRRVEDRIQVHCEPATRAGFHVRYSTRDYATPDAGYPRPLADNWWNLPDELLGDDDTPIRVDAVLVGRDNRTYLFAGPRFVVSDSKRRWWSAPRSLRADWDSLPFERIDAAFVGADDRTYLFSGADYVRYSGAAYTEVDDRYPARISAHWGNVVNNIARTGRVDAALVVDSAADPDAGPGPIHTYLFSGDQFVRYTGTDYATVDDGYPRRLSALPQEPRLAHLRAALDRVDAAFADRRNVYLVSGGECHVVSAAGYRRYADLPGSGTDLAAVTCAYIEDGSVLVERPDGWHRHSSLEGTEVGTEPARPRSLRSVPVDFRSGLDAVLVGVDGNTYLFKGTTCFNTQLNRGYPLAEEWGRPRNNIYHDNRVDAAFVGRDGRTYVFSGDQFVSYPGAGYLDTPVEAEPQPVAAHWGGLHAVALAFVRDGTTYLFEPPDPTGAVRYVSYSGPDYRRPDDGTPVATDAGFWAIPDGYLPEGFVAPEAVLFEGDSMLLLTGALCLQRDERTGAWSYPRPLEVLWRGIGTTSGSTAASGLTAAFTGRDGATYFFFTGGEFSRYHDGRFTPRETIRARWGRSRNNFLAPDGAVDAAVVVAGVTYLFSGDQYVRYSGADYRYVDAGYPMPIGGNLRREAAFANLPASFDDELADRAALGARSLVDAAVANDRTSYLFAAGACHAVSRAVTASHDVAALGRIHNAVADRQRVDAALVTADHTYLFSGDQYVRYSGRHYDHVDDGYPRRIATSLPPELGIAELPVAFRDGIDAALRTADGRTYLFAGRQYLRIDGESTQVAPIAGAWGTVGTEFGASAPIDAAFVAPGGDLYAFAGGQYVRYRPGGLDAVEPGHPRPIRDGWGDLPTDFDLGIDGAFVLAGRTYLCRGDEYVRYGDERFDARDRTLAQPFRHRWSDSADYRLHDVRVISRFTELARAYPGDGGLAAFLLPGPISYPDPYRHLAELFGWNVDDLRWCRRNSRFLSDAPADEDRFEYEFLLELVDLFAVTDRFGAGPAQVRADVWSRLYERRPVDPAATDPAAAAAALYDADLDAAGTALYAMLARRHAGGQWPVLSRQIHDELNVRRRDALVPAVLALSAGRELTSRDLFERFLIDVDMGSQGRTSRVREAIAATQLYVHRFLLNLEPGPDPDPDLPSDTDAEAARQRVKVWWTWMRSYRVWEANRKVFLYPENYLRPELRPNRTPAFRALEGDLLQGEITAESVERAYRRYLDEYTEVSRLAIAGGYVYTKDRDQDGPRRLILFGRTRTDPRRFYYRRAEFGSAERASATWEPWQPVDLQIDADQVHPVHAFGRVFVFWASTEAVADDGDPTTTSVVVADEGGRQRVSGRAKTQRVRIHYSFYNLNKEWVPAQTLGTGGKEEGTISAITLLVRPRVKDDGSDRTSIVAACSYTVTGPPPQVAAEGAEPADGAGSGTARRAAVLFDLNPELYADDLLDAESPDGLTPEGVAVVTDLEATAARTSTADWVARIFVDPVDPAGVVTFDHPAGTDTLSWFSVDHKGGSFLCRPVPVGGPVAVPRPLAGNPDRLPQWPRVDAAVELPDGTRYFFDNTARSYATAAPPPDPDTSGPDGAGPGSVGPAPGPPEPVADRWGRQPTVLAAPGVVDAVLTRGEQTFVFSGEYYVRFTGTPFEKIDAGYPLRIDENDEDIPQWSTVDAAFTGRDGIEYFFSRSRGEYVTSEDLGEPRGVEEHWSRRVDGFGDLDAALVTNTRTYLISGDKYLRYSLPRRRGTGDGTPPPPYDEPDEGFPKPLAGNRDGLPTTFPIGAALWRQGTRYYFDNVAGEYHVWVNRTPRETRPTSRPQGAMADSGTVDAGWVADGRLYLTHGTEYVRYTLDPQDGSVSRWMDADCPKPLPYPVTAAFTRDDDVYLFSGTGYSLIDAGQEPDQAPPLRPTAVAWAELPREPTAATPPFDAALDSASGLYLFVDGEYLVHPKTATVRRPYLRGALPFELIRLTTGTASELNRRLLAGGVAALLDLSTQETDEQALGVESDPGPVIRVRRRMVDPGRLPTGSHLDFRSANGIYYWEIFYHAPLLIAQALNTAQRFADARQWYEYVFDPTNRDSYWRFLPFLSADLSALAGAVTGGLADLDDLGLDTGGLRSELEPVLDALRTLAPVLAQNRDPATADERAALLTIASPATRDAVTAALTALETGDRTGPQRAAIAGLRERTAIIAGLEKQFDVLGDRESLLRAYRDNPFDPHAIADLRPVAHRRAVVMGYLDNLLDWGDLLFRQYTPESVDEARMLYVLAHDLLGERAGRLGVRMTPAPRGFADLDPATDLDLIGQLTGGGDLIEGTGAVHASVADGYFHLPENAVFAEYWVRVEDRLRKIRQSLDILGVAAPLPLFAPPLDPMALVRSAASGAAVDAATVAATVPPPAYRFTAVFRRAQELVDRLRQFGAELLDVLERRDAEALSLLRGRQEEVILAMTRQIRQSQVQVAEAHLAELTAGQSAAQDRQDHYQKLIDEGMSALEQAQLGLMGTAAATHFASSVLKVAAGIAYAVPQFKAGPFIIGVESGGRQLGDTIDKAAEVAESLGEGFSVLGEVLGVRAQHERTSRDWELQLKTAQSDLAQIGHQLTGATQQLAIARQEAALHEQEVAHDRAIAEFMRDKFGTVELYGWMSGQLGALYFQAYQLAYEMAKSAERAYQFERGVPEAQAGFIRPTYWDSRRGGLLASANLGLDLERLGKAYLDTDTRGLEITKQISLLELDPFALLRLRESATCEFALTETEFDYDFPGHYRRQLRTLTVTFVDADGQPLWVNATLTQLSHKTVLEPDPRAVAHLLDPKGLPPETVRADWRPSQQIALSEVDGDNNGLFELRFDDERYLPFEGTGAVSTWRLERAGRAVAEPYDVILTVRYTAEQGGAVFANAVRGMLKPYPAARFFDVAREFPDEWAAFVADESPQLALPLTPELFPGMSTRQISAIYARFEIADGSAPRLVLDGGRNLALRDGQLLPTPGLSIGADPSAPLTLALDGEKESLRNVGLVLTYQAQVR